MVKIFNKKLIILAIGCVIAMLVFVQQYFVKNLHVKISCCKEEQELLAEKFNNRIEQLNKQLFFIKEENKNIKTYSQSLEEKIEVYQRMQQEIEEKLNENNQEKLLMEKNHLSEHVHLEHKIKNLKKENVDLHGLIKELQAQIQTYKVNSYSLFQAGKLEIELSTLEQQLAEQYEQINYKKNNITELKEKCGTLRMNAKFCKEYDAALGNIMLLEKQLDHLHSKRDDLKHRINVYLSSSSQTNAR